MAFDVETFWQWTEFSDYLLFLSITFSFFGLLTYMLINVTLYVELLGFACLLLEAMQPLPQFLKNYRSNSTHGMRSLMLHNLSLSLSPSHFVI